MTTFLQIVKGILLGLVQGLTEFLPISSSGHLILLEKLGVAPPSVFLNLLLHVATLLAVCILLRKDLWGWIRHPLSRESRWMILSLVPTVALAVATEIWAKPLLAGAYVSLGFLATSFVLVLGTRLRTTQKPLSVGNALLCGLLHGLAVAPGLSRSGTTVVGMQALGIDQTRAVRLSFLLSIPVILGGTVWECIGGVDLSGIDIPFLVSAVVAAFVSGLISLRLMLSSFGKSLPVFALYTFALAIVGLWI